MEPDLELLKVLSEALTRGQGGFTEADLQAAFEDFHKLVAQGMIANLVATGELDVLVEDGAVLYSAAGNKPLTLEALIERMGDGDGEVIA